MFFAAAYSSFGQSQNWWRVNGNTPAASDYLGTQNNTPLIIKTNNAERARFTENGWVGIGTASPTRMLDVNGQSRFRLKVQCDSLLEASMLKITGLAGGAGLLNVNASGNVNKILYTGHASDVLTGAGTFTPLSSLLPSPLWQQNASGIFYNGNVGINKSNPQFALDVTGDLNVSHNVYVGGGVVIANRANLDTADFGGGRIQGNGNAVEVIGDFRAQNKLEVMGNAEIAGNLKLSNLSSFVGNTLNLIVADPNGNLKVLGPGPFNPPSIACPNPLNPVSSAMWLVGGQQLNAADCNYFGSINNVSLSIGVNAHHIINLAQGVYNNNIPAGKVGINTAPPPGPELSMEIYGSLSIMNGGDVSLYLGRNNLIGSGTAAENYGEWGIQYLRSVSNNGHPGGLNFWKPWQSTGVSGNGFLFLSDNGNVGIGCLNPQYKLDVDGTVRAKEVRVKITGCDYVFDDKYKLEDLRKRKEKVLKEKHLPGLKNWNGENDMNLRELVEVLWKTIEEHELYIYQLEEEINELKKTNKN
jgi:hypothetical protein